MSAIVRADDRRGDIAVDLDVRDQYVVLVVLRLDPRLHVLVAGLLSGVGEQRHLEEVLLGQQVAVGSREDATRASSTAASSGGSVSDASVSSSFAVVVGVSTGSQQERQHAGL